MNPFRTPTLSVAVALTLSLAPVAATAANAPEDGHGAFVTGVYRNLFAEAGHSQAEIDARVNASFQQLFHGEPGDLPSRTSGQAIYYEAGSDSNGPMAYITDIKHNDVRTEGMSYGMIICAEMDKKKEFDALWNWSRHYLYHTDPTDPGYRFYAWQARTNGDRMSQGVAPDGEQYYTMALFFAAGRWPGGTGIYDYKAQALQLLHDLRHREWIIGNPPPINRGGRGGRGGGFGGGPTNAAGTNAGGGFAGGFGGGFGGGGTNAGGTNAGRGFGGGFGGGGRGGAIGSGPVFDEASKMVLFSPESRNTNAMTGGYTDPSYHLPAFYELWARWGAPEDRDFWMGAAQASRDYFVKAASPVTGLTPHDTAFDGSVRGGRGGGFGGAAHYDYDACRTAGNWSVDWSWWGKDPRERDLSDKLQAFFESKGMDTYGCQYTLDGQPYPANNPDTRHAEGVVGVNADASLAATDAARAKKFVEALWNTPTPAGLERYYEGLLYQMALLHCSGEFRILPPK
jgi:oligosaccharide reducing-end xylanase